MDDNPRSTAINLHDLRHSLSLLACDLRLSRGRMAAGQGQGSEYPVLLERLDRGLAAMRDLLAGGKPSRSGGRPDLAAQMAAVWQRFLMAGRLQAEFSSFRVEGPLYWAGDFRHWHSLLVNLLENASKAAPLGPVELVADADGLRVSNGGSLPDPEVVKGFQRGVLPAPREARGCGLSLILEAAAALGLAAELSVTEDRCHFHFRKGPADAPRILLVEDDGDLRAMLAEYIRAEGFRVDTRADADGMAPVPGRYLAVVADLNLPGRSGRDFLAAWRAEDPETRTILLTGAGEAAAREWRGVDAVLLKPGLGPLRDLLLTLLPAGRRR